METIQQILTKYWGYSTFRPLQEEIINSTLAKKDTLALLPTGGGKSICFQVPTMAQEGICIVISPLIALMKDQVMNLQKKGIRAMAITSAMSKKEIDISLDNCIYGGFKFLYISPERLTTEITQERIKQMNVNLIAVDEAHCISQWGYDFRPAYLKIAELKKLKPETPILALTATATPEVAKDIMEKLEFPSPNLIQQSFERDNLAYVVQHTEDKLTKLEKIINGIKGSGVVYVRDRKSTIEISNHLQKLNIAADYYHAGLPHELRDKKQANWINEKIRVIVATNAFGMGIDKSNVRFVVHMDLPDCIEAYFQEAGRAGRDGKKAYAVLIYSNVDKANLSGFVQNRFPTIELIRRVYSALGNYYQLATGSGQGQTFSFNISEFSNSFSFKPLEVYNALKFIEREGYITVSEAFFTPSRIKFTINKDELYKFQVANKKYDVFIKLLLRSYSGVFSNYTNIKEHELADRLKAQKDMVTAMLIKLAEYEILDYIPQNNSPQITFLQERVDHKKLHISNEVLINRKKVANARMDAIFHYAESVTKCRSQLLLAYFGETETYRCGICDVCLERNKLDISSLEFEKISNQVKALINENPMDLPSILKQLKYSNEEMALKVIQWLTDNGKIRVDVGGLYMWGS